MPSLYRIIPPGKAPPWDLNVIIEIPEGGEAVKYEFDAELGVMRVDRFLHTAMTYPGNYGFIPGTLADDGDPHDVIILGQAPVVPGCLVRARPVGALIMTDEAGGDDKILALPIDALNPAMREVRTCAELPALLLKRVAHFFQHYKDLEANAHVSEPRWAHAEEAAALVMRAIQRGSGGVPNATTKD